MALPRIKSAALLAVVILLPASLAAMPSRSPLYIDLNASPIYARIGFDPVSLANVPSAGMQGWKILPPAGPGGRLVRPSDLNFAEVPKRPPFSMRLYPPIEFTYLLPFQVSKAMLSLLGGGSPGAGIPAKVAGLFLAGIGDNWEAYVNGTLVASDMHLTPEGAIGLHRNMRERRLPLDGRVFREGSNILALRIVADPGYLSVGLTQARPFYIDEYQSIEAANSDIWPMVLIGLYLFIGLYHIFMFFIRTQDRHNLFYGFFSLDLGLYLFMRSYTITRILADSDLISRIELITLALILPLVGAFLETLQDNKIKKITFWYGGFCLIVALAQLLVPINATEDVLRLWQASGLVMAFYYFGVDILWRFVSDGKRRWKRERDYDGGRTLGRIYLKALVREPIGNLLIGGFILFVTAVFDIVDAVVMRWDLVLTKYGFFLFTMGTALILANRMGFLHDRLSGLNKTLEERIGVLVDTTARLTASEQRYRSLFEGSSDPIALLTEDLAFIEGNLAAKELFGLNRPSFAPATLPDAVYAEPREGTLPVEFLRAVSRSLQEKKAPGEIILRIKAPIGEPRSCKLRLERIDALERREILLRVVPEEKDALAEAFIEGRERFDIESSLFAADNVCRRAVAYLSRYMGNDDARLLATCLHEIVVNAVEHGNLRIGFDEKSESMKTGHYFELMQERRLDPRYRSLRIVVEYSISASRATFRVTDEGPGFDHRKYAKGPGEDLSAELLEHGRGLFLTMSAFDKVIFNERGNQVTMVKFLGGTKASQPS